ncbi:S9 family peptidase [Methanobrevibacter sp.]|uniref:alpha/beta hydrolase family protein n=1 Tax=Methanobrevibacter sp. TaxID=66852 RepID=UPI0025D9A3F9|nr:alpha/beta hydrolase [Methanobrevibacter sp.]MBQ2665186.1 alpha/beta hydrolase [Methanobrevibacter sp.]
MYFEDRFFINDEIYCEAYIPREDCPIVIYAHSLGMSYRSGYEYFRELLKRNIGCVTFDFRGGGYSSKSKGKTTEMSLISEADDIITVFNHVKQWDFIDKDRIILLGTSQGGAASAVAASKLQNDLRGLIILYPALLIPDVAHEYNSLSEIPDTQLFNGWIEVGKCYFEDAWNLDIFKEIGKYKKEVLIIHGTSDYIVPYPYSVKAHESYENSQLRLIEGAGHGFSGDKFRQCMSYVNDYLNKVLK